MDEFALINAYFRSLSQRLGGAPSDLGIGDDCALVSVPPGKQLAVTTDTLIEGVHFPRDTDPADIGYKALAVNLSDLAAMGAAPAWFTLCLTLPVCSSEWLERFCQGMGELMQQRPVALIGGDTTRGALSLSIQAMGLVDQGRALLRSGARPHDDIYVSGVIGEAGIGLQIVQQQLPVTDQAMQVAVQHLNRPQPRIVLGQALVGLATACIDVSDGLLADLGHILERSGVGARIDPERVPVAVALHNDVLLKQLGWQDGSRSAVQLFALSAGDDYELCFTAPPSQRGAIDQLAQRLDIPLTRIGVITETPGLLNVASGEAISTRRGYTHF